MMRIKELNTVCVILGSMPDQNAQALCDYMAQAWVGRDSAFQTIAYECTNHQTNVSLHLQNTEFRKDGSHWKSLSFK